MLHEAAPCTCGLLYGSCGGGCSLLSLGTPSTRRAEAGARVPASAGLPWEAVLSCNGRHESGAARTDQRNAGTASPRRCANCDTASTPLWRNGPRGPKSLCNACGIRYKKEERRAAAAAVASDSGVEHVCGSRFQIAGYSYRYSRI